MAAQSQYEAESAGRMALAGRIERDMREAYYRWLQARAQIGIFEATLELATENRRVNESLFRNGKITRDLVFRAEADQLEVQQSQLGAQNAARLAQSYVNLIRNAPFDWALPVVLVDDPDIDRLRNDLAAHAAQPTLSLAPLQDTAVRQRYELRQLDAARQRPPPAKGLRALRSNPGSPSPSTSALREKPMPSRTRTATCWRRSC